MAVSTSLMTVTDSATVATDDILVTRHCQHILVTRRQSHIAHTRDEAPQSRLCILPEVRVPATHGVLPCMACLCASRFVCRLRMACWRTELKKL